MSLIRDLSLSAAIGLLVSLTANGCKLAFTNYTPEADEWLAYAAMAACPFAVLAISRLSGRAEWLLAVLLTAGAWGMYLLQGIPQLATRGSTDMALGIIVGTSWIWITAAVLLVGLLPRAFRQVP